MYNDLFVLLVDDEELSLRTSRSAMERFIPREQIFCARSTVETVEILTAHRVQLAFLDIEMPDASGFAVSEYIHSNYPQVQVVFLTGHVDLGARSFDYDPFDFLVKPVDLLRLERTLRKFAALQAPAAREEKLAIRTEAGFVLVDPREILYIEKEHNRAKLYCAGDKLYLVKYSLDRLEALFAGYDFFRVHQSFLVPLSGVRSVGPAPVGTAYQLTLACGRSLPVSRENYPRLREQLARSGIRFM